MLRAIFGSTLLVGISLNEAQAERPRTGEDLLRLCESPADQYDRDYCIGYTRGAEMAVREGDKQQRTCTIAIPAEVTDRELVESVIVALKAQPELLRQPVIDVVLTALTSRWPCD
jgi:hypothetical protein